MANAPMPASSRLRATRSAPRVVRVKTIARVNAGSANSSTSMSHLRDASTWTTFCSTRSTVVAAGAIHGNKSQGQRERALEAFRSGKTRALVATDIAARGIDIDDVTHVVNFELPDVAESYVHRIGRTARAGSGGIAIAFCAPDEKDSLRAIERLVKQPLTSMGGDRNASAPKPERGRVPERSERSHQGPRGNRRNTRRAA